MELSIREIGYGDQTINKKMKDYLNLFYAMIDKINDWDNLTQESKSSTLAIFLDNTADIKTMINYFEKYQSNLKKNTLNSYIKGVFNN